MELSIGKCDKNFKKPLPHGRGAVSNERTP
jgi:hypothetical protein